jgi:transcriptional regulator with XRE-family HTH domain
MKGEQVREARRRLGLTQHQAAKRWRVSQAYLSLAETGKRRVPDRLARLLVRVEPSMATGLALEVSDPSPDQLPRLLGGLGYPGFAYLADPRAVANPAAVVLAALQTKSVPARVTEALPWVLATFVDLDWNWLLAQAKLSNLQNRLGYLVHLGRQVAEKRGDLGTAARLTEVESRLEEARLVKEDVLGRDLTAVEQRHFREHRPSAAAHWNLLTNLRAEDLRYGA